MVLARPAMAASLRGLGSPCGLLSVRGDMTRPLHSSVENKPSYTGQRLPVGSSHRALGLTAPVSRSPWPAQLPHPGAEMDKSPWSLMGSEAGWPTA